VAEFVPSLSNEKTGKIFQELPEWWKILEDNIEKRSGALR
jgi:hypothetical protein